MRRTKRRPCPRARSQLYSAVLAPPMCSTPVGEGAKRSLVDTTSTMSSERAQDARGATKLAMLIGAHVSTAGGLVDAHRRGVERGCDAIQVFNQSPRMWRPTRWKPDDVAEFLELMKEATIQSVTSAAVCPTSPAIKAR